MKIAVLATGDELVNGDILNTNGQFIAQQLLEIGLPVHMHVAVGDAEASLLDAMEYLLKQHDILITIGGLGPTSDDRTRFALAKTLDFPLEFDEASWQAIVERLKILNLSVPESNRQQALFPKGAEIIPNANGTARACCVHKNNKTVYMLPGPPQECLPIFKNAVLPYLEKNFAQKIFRASWLLLGMSEGHLAQQLDPLLPQHPAVILGYRIAFPYLEVKLQSFDEAAFNTAKTDFFVYVENHLISQNKKTASDQLIETLAQVPIHLWIQDHATGGWLQNKITRAATYSQLHFLEPAPKVLKENQFEITITGLQEFWRDDFTLETSIHLRIRSAEKTDEKTLSIVQRRERTLPLAGERICWELLHYLRTAKII